MRIAVTGKSGQVATALAALNGTAAEIVHIARPELNLLDRSSVYSSLKNVSPDIVVSAAAYTAVDKAESEPDVVFAVNRDGARGVAEVAAELNIPIIHLSTDYVFDGRKPSPYVEDDPACPVSVYGASKLAGEIAVANVARNHVILRTAWVYSPYGQNFVKTMLRLGETRNELSVVEDQHGCPTSADDIADAILKIAANVLNDNSDQLRGVFHLTGHGNTTWADFAKAIFSVVEEVQGKHIEVQGITTSEYPTPAKRPKNSLLDCSKLRAIHAIKVSHWEGSVRQTVKTLLRGGEL